MNPDKIEVMVVNNAENLELSLLPIFDGVPLTFADFIRHLGIILDPELLLKKQVFSCN